MKVVDFRILMKTKNYFTNIVANILLVLHRLNNFLLKGVNYGWFYFYNKC